MYETGYVVRKGNPIVLLWIIKNHNYVGYCNSPIYIGETVNKVPANYGETKQIGE